MTFAVSMSGLSNFSQAIDVIGNNLGLANTIGFKKSQVHFTDAYAAAISDAMGLQSPGLGAGSGSVFQSFQNGNVSTTGKPLDLAITGQGFFRMNNNGSIVYSRNGQFHLAIEPAKTGVTLTPAELARQKVILANVADYHVSGYLADYANDPKGVIVKSSSPQDILIDTNMSATVTNKVSASVNLDANLAQRTMAFDLNDPQTYNSAATTKIYDSSGNAHDLTMYFAKTAPNTWQTYATFNADLKSLTYPLSVTAGTNDQFSIQVDGGAQTTVTLPPGQYVNADALKTGFKAAIDTALGPDKANVSIDSVNHLVVSSVATGKTSTVVLSEGNGALSTYLSVTKLAGSLKFDSIGNLDPQSSQIFTVNYGAGAPPLLLDFSGSTQFGNSFEVSSMTRDGFAAGQLLGLSVGSDGIIQASYSNGLTRKAGQIVLGDFTNPNGLFSRGNGQWAESLQSGAVRLDTPANPDATNSLGFGAIQAAAIEESNVSLNEEFLALLTQQRFYQANAEAIKAQDQMLQTLANIR